MGKMTVVGILLAAGRSLRFGEDKLLYCLNNIPIAILSARTLSYAVDMTVVITRPDSQLPNILKDEQVTTITCRESLAGMGNSIACGVSASLEADAWVIALADMPFIQIDTIQHLVRLLRQGSSIVVPTVDGRYGHPVGFHRRYATQLRELSSDKGAKSLLQRYAYDIVLFSCEDRGIYQDIDTLEDLNKVL